MIELITPRWMDAVRYVCGNLRPIDAREIFGAGPAAPQSLAREVLLAGGPGYIVFDRRDMPAALIGARPTADPAVWEVWSFGTRNYGQAALSVTRLIRRSMIPGLREAGVRRLTCLSMDGHEDGRRWLDHFGAVQQPEPIERLGGVYRRYVLEL